MAWVVGKAPPAFALACAAALLCACHGSGGSAGPGLEPPFGGGGAFGNPGGGGMQEGTGGGDPALGTGGQLATGGLSGAGGQPGRDPADGGVQGDDPVAVDPCDEDPLAVSGAVRPAFATTPPGFAASAMPGQPGPLQVVAMDVVIPSMVGGRADLSATLYLPSENGSEPIDGPLPLVLVLHGFSSNHYAYAHFSTHFASHGFVALGLSFPFSAVAEHDVNAQEALGAIDHVLSTGGPVPGLVDPARIAASGHSMGGKIAFYAAALDGRIDLVVGWDPSNAGGPPCFVDPNSCHALPVAPNCATMDAGIVHRVRGESLVFRAAPDGTNPEAVHNAIHFFRGAPAPATLVDFDGNVAHADWASMTGAPVAHTRAVQTALMLHRFYGVDGLDAWLPGGASIAAGQGVERVLRK